MERGRRNVASGAALPAATFGVVVLSFACVNIVAIHRIGGLRVAVNEIVGNMLASVALVSRMGHDIEEKHLLVETHIFQKEQVDMARTEGRIAALERDFQDAARQYEPLATLPHEHEPGRSCRRIRELWTRPSTERCRCPAGTSTPKRKWCSRTPRTCSPRSTST